MSVRFEDISQKISYRRVVGSFNLLWYQCTAETASETITKIGERLAKHFSFTTQSIGLYMTLLTKQPPPCRLCLIF